MADLTRLGTNPNTGVSDPGRDIRPTNEFLAYPFTLAAGVSVQKGQVLALNTAGRAVLADASVGQPQALVGIALDKSRRAGDRVSVLVYGPVSGYDGAPNPGLPVYLSDTAGEVGDGAGAVSLVLGRVWPDDDESGEDVIFFNFLP
jgi:hypothetical protein